MSKHYTLERTPDGGIRLGGRLTFGTCSALYRELERLGEHETAAGPVDLSGVVEVDSAGLALLLEWQARQRRNGRRLALHDAPQSLLSLAQLADAVELLNLSGRSPAA